MASLISKLDYCNSALAGTFGFLQNRLPSVLTEAVRLVYLCWTSEGVAPLLRELHWLRVSERIKFRCACWRKTTCTADRLPGIRTTDIRGSRSSSSALCRHHDAADHQMPSSGRATLTTAHFRRLCLEHGTVCRPDDNRHIMPIACHLLCYKSPAQNSEDNWKHSCFRRTAAHRDFFDYCAL